MYVNAQRTLTLRQKPVGSYAGGALHGMWYADHMVHISDRRLKTKIRPLVEDLDDREKLAASRPGASAITPGTGAAWVLRELRPVSYYFKRDAEAKHQRFGFIADEIAQTIPQVVEEQSNEQKTKGIAYQDIIAVLTAILQSLSSRVEIADGMMQTFQSRLATIEEGFKQLQAAVEETTILRAKVQELTLRLTAMQDSTKPSADLLAEDVLSKLEARVSAIEASLKG